MTLRFLQLPFCAIALALAPGFAAAAPTITNRAPAPDEWGYRPDDGSVVGLNPPSLTWLLEKDAATYTIQLAKDRRFESAITARDIPWPTYTHHTTLEPGHYVWRSRFRTEEGEESDWSVVRGFMVPADGVAMPMPTRAEQSARVPDAHPRLFLRPEDLTRIRAAAAGRAAAEFNALRQRADQIMGAGPTPEPEHLGSARDKDNAEMVKYWSPNREQTMKACEEAEVIAFVALVTREPRYRAAARRWVLHLASWDPDGPTNFHLNCEAGKPLLYRLPRAYDWAFEALTESDRQAVRAVMTRRIHDAWESGEVLRGVGHLNRPYNSHGNRVWHQIGEAGIAFLGEIPEAETWLDYAVNKFYACYPVWSDSDGGWHEGVSYWGGYMSKAVWWLQAARSALDIDGLKKPFFAQVGDFPLYVAPPGAPNMGFGDLSSGTPSASWGGFLEYFLRARPDRPEGGHAGAWRWWTEQWQMRGQDGVLGFLYEVNLPPLPAAKAPADLPTSKVFHGIGVASLHTTLMDSRDDVHLLFKSSPIGSQSHGHNPQNTFQLNAYGEALLTTCVYRDLHGSRFHYGWAHSTIAHNSVLVGGAGQKKHAAEPQGRIVAEILTPAYDYIAGDATAAYEGRLTRFLWNVVFVKDVSTPLLVLYDDLQAPRPTTFQFLLHALDPFDVSEGDARLLVQRPRAGVSVKYLGPGPLSFRQWDGYEPKPTPDFPNQWHVEASTRQEADRVEMLTILVPFRGKETPRWNARRIESGDAIGVQVTIDGAPVSVAHRRHGVTGEALWNGRTFAGPVLVEK
jgi:hypothetical protein